MRNLPSAVAPRKRVIYAIEKRIMPLEARKGVEERGKRGRQPSLSEYTARRRRGRASVAKSQCATRAFFAARSFVHVSCPQAVAARQRNAAMPPRAAAPQVRKEMPVLRLASASLAEVSPPQSARRAAEFDAGEAGAGEQRRRFSAAVVLRGSMSFER